MNQLSKPTKTSRGFPVVEFKDQYGSPCSLQASSVWLDDNKPGASCVWLGPDEAEPKVMASKAASFGVETTETTGWVPYPIPEGVLLSTRMHLNRGQVEALIVHLQKWLKTGKF